MREAEQATKTYQNYIAGEWVAASRGETYETRDPGSNVEGVGSKPLSMGIGG